MAAIASTAFAVDFSLSAHLSSGYVPYITDTSMTPIPFIAFPSFGIAVGFDKLDILAEIDYGLFRQTEYKGEINEYKFRLWALGFNVGVAPKINAGDRFTFSFPILFKFVHIGMTEKEINPDFKRKHGRNAIGIDFGARASFAFNHHWSGFFGIQMPIFTGVTQTKSKTKPSTFTGEGKDPQFFFMNYGTIDLGVKFTF